MRGDLSETSAADACRDLARRAATGALALQGPDGPGRILFVDGRLIAAVSPTPRARLGDRLVGAGLLDDDALTTALRLQADDPGSTRLGALLVGRGLVRHDAVRLFVQEQLLDAVFEIIGWRYGTFEFVEGRGAEIPEVPLELSVDDALVEVSRRQQEWDELSQLIPDLEAVPAFSSAAASAAAALEPDEFAVLASVDGERSIRELAADLGYGEFEAARIVYGLALLGVLEVQLPEDEVGAALDEAFAYFSEPSVEEDAPGPAADEEVVSDAAEEPAGEVAEVAEVAAGAEMADGEELPSDGDEDGAPTQHLEDPGTSDDVDVWVAAADEPDDEASSDVLEPTEQEASADVLEPTDEGAPAARPDLDDDLGAILTALRDEPAPADTSAAAPTAAPAEATATGDPEDTEATDEPPVEADDGSAGWSFLPPPPGAPPAADDEEALRASPADEDDTTPAARSGGAASSADVSELLRELSRLAIDDPPPKDEPPRRSTDDDPPPQRPATPPDEAKRKKRGLFGWGG
jgi:hypothetical protein